MTILVIGGIAGVSLAAQVAEAAKHAQRNDQRTEQAGHVMNRVSLWSRTRLVASLGQRTWQSMVLDVTQLSPVLFRIRVQEPISRADVLTTVVYRRLDDPNGN
jgi:hypothetical protein